MVVGESPGLTVAERGGDRGDGARPAQGRARADRDGADGAVNQERAAGDGRRHRAVVGRQAQRARALLGQPRSSRVTTPLRRSVAAALSTVTVPVPGLKVIGRLTVEVPVACEASIDPASDRRRAARDGVAARLDRQRVEDPAGDVVVAGQGRAGQARREDRGCPRPPGSRSTSYWRRTSCRWGWWPRHPSPSRCPWAAATAVSTTSWPSVPPA